MYGLFMARRWNAQKKFMVIAAVDGLMESDEFVMNFFERRYTISALDEPCCSGVSLAALSRWISVMNQSENEEDDAYDG